MKNLKIKIKSYGYKIFKFFSFGLAFSILIFAFLTIYPKEANAGTIIKSPAHLGLSNGLVGCWSFDGSYAKVPDCSGSGNTGTITGSLTKSAGKIGQALIFNEERAADISEYVTVANDSDIANIFAGGGTISVWIYYNRENSEVFTTIANKAGGISNGGWNLGVCNNWVGQCDAIPAGQDTITFHHGATSDGNWAAPLSAISSKKSQWVHVVITFNKDNINNTPTIYINGNSVTITELQDPSGTFADDSSRSVIIGNFTDGLTPFAGKIDELRLYKGKMLSDHEIQRLYQIGLGSKANRSITNSSFNQGLVSHWTFDADTLHGTSTLVIDDKSGLGNKASASGTGIPTKISGKVGQALDFDGVNDFISTVDYNAVDGLNRLTFGGWFNIAIPGGNGVIMSDWDSVGLDGWAIELDGTPSPYGIGCTIRNTSDGYTYTSASYDGEFNEWHHVICVYDGTQTGNANRTKLYIDGIQQTLIYVGGNVPASLNGNNLGTVLGSDRGIDADFTESAYDDIRIYNRALSAAEINRLYMTTQSKYNASKTDSLKQGLVGYWTFDGGDIFGTSARDKSGSNFHGTISGAFKASGKLGQALDFDGVDDVVEMTEASALDFSPQANEFTIAAWFKTRSIGTTIMGKGEETLKQYTMFISSSAPGEFGGIIGNAAPSTSGIRVDNGAWHHGVVVNYNDSGVFKHKFYVDGVQAPNVYNSGSENGTCNISIGKRYTTCPNTGSAAPFSGLVDEVRIYNRALSASEINKLYQMGR